MTLRQLRTSKDMSLREAAEAAGLKASKLSDYERGADLPGTDEIQALSQVYGVSMDEIRNGLPAPAEAIAHAEEFGKFMKAHRAAKDHAKAAGLGRGNGGQGEMPCPTGCGGTLRYTVANVNGHMWAACSTKSCVRWME